VNVEKTAAWIPSSAEVLIDWDFTERGKFHLDDNARLNHWACFPLFMDPDRACRPWRFAHANPLPDFVLFPRGERLVADVREFVGEARRRWRNVIASARGEEWDEWA